MRKPGLVLSLLVLSVIIISGCVSNDVPENTDGLHTDSINNDSVPQGANIFHKDFVLSMPDGWMEVEFMPSVFIYLPEGSDYTNPETEIVSISASILPVDSEYTLLGLVDESIEEIRNILPDMAITQEPSEVALGDMDGLEIRYDVTVAGKMKEYTQLFAQKYNSLYIATHSCLKGECSYDSEFLGMTKSLVSQDPRNT